MPANIYVRVIQHYKTTILVTLLLVLAITAAGTWFLPKTYTAQSTLRVATSAGGSLDYVNYQTEYSDRFMNTLAKYAAGDRVGGQLQAQFGLNKAPKIRANIVAKTEWLELSVEAATPQLAADLTNALSQLVVAQGKTLPNQDLELAQNDLLQRMATAQQDIDKAQVAYQSALSESPNDAKRVGTLREEVSLNERLYLSLLEQFNRVRLASSILGEAIVIEHAAAAPTSPSAPNWPMNLGLGALLGLVSGTGLAFFAARNDTRVYTSEDLQALLPALLLGEIPQREKQRRLGKKARSRVFEDNTMELEGIRRVRVNLIALQQRSHFNAVVAVSAEPGEGKSTLVANLAASMARVGKRVAVVDGDMRLPTLHESFQLPNQFGLSSLLLDEQMDVHDVMHSPIPNVSVITSGVSPANPGELLGTSRMHSIINQLSEEFDMVLVDSPALLAAADGITVARITGHALFVASCQVARRETVHAASRQIIDLGVNLLGLVVNGAERPYDYHYHRSSRQKNRYLA